jgi:hypothetical protein
MGFSKGTLHYMKKNAEGNNRSRCISKLGSGWIIGKKYVMAMKVQK